MIYSYLSEASLPFGATHTRVIPGRDWRGGKPPSNPIRGGKEHHERWDAKSG